MKNLFQSACLRAFLRMTAFLLSFPRVSRGLILFGFLAFAAQAQATLPIEHWRTSTGAEVYFVESRNLPILDVSVDFPAGSSADTPEKSGLANLTRHLLPLGAGGLSENDISSRLADVGAVLGSHFDPDRAGITLRTLSGERERDQALDILARILQRPEFPEAVLAREKARIVAVLQEEGTRPEVIAQRAFAKLLYGTHPYGLRESGEVDTVEKLTRDDLVRFYQAHYRAGSAVVALMGDVSRRQAEAIAEQLTQGLPPGKAKLDLPPVKAPHSEMEEIPHPASQAHILLGYPGVKRKDPDYFPLFVGNYILGGGGFVSRLTEEIREKRGLAYSVYSYFYPLEQEGPFQIGLQTKKDQALEALKVVHSTLDNFIADGPTEGELEKAKDHIIGGFPLRIDSNRKIIEYLAVIGFYRLPLTYLDDFVRNVAKVTTFGIRDAFQRRIKPEDMVTVIVGAPQPPDGK